MSQILIQYENNTKWKATVTELKTKNNPANNITVEPTSG